MSEDDSIQTEEHREPRHATCPNCGTRIEGPWCYQCGQNQKGINRFFLSLLNEAFDDVFSLNSRTVRTLKYLIFRPGFLTTEYFAGRRARYLPPVRLYLITSVIFFLYLSLQNTLSDSSPMLFSLETPPDEARQELDDTSSGLEQRIAELEARGGGNKVDEKIVTDLETAGKELENLSDEEAADLKISLPWLTEDEEKILADNLMARAKKAEENPGALADALIDIAPPILFVILPLFAILLKVFYPGTGRYYSEHLILAVHNHSFLFVALLFSQLLETFEDTFVAPATGAVDTALQIWIPVYMYLSLRRTYEQGYGVTAIKFVFLFLGYQIFFGMALAGMIIWGLMSL